MSSKDVKDIILYAMKYEQYYKLQLLRRAVIEHLLFTDKTELSFWSGK